MSPRNNFWTMLILAGLVFANVHEAKANPLQPAPEAQKNMFIRFFQDHISAVDGNRCCMTPSCSEYAAQAVKKHGPVIGWIMACDRLVRCGRDEVRVSPHVCINGQEFVSDPVSANDFWWFKKEDKTREFPK